MPGARLHAADHAQQPLLRPPRRAAPQGAGTQADTPGRHGPASVQVSLMPIRLCLEPRCGNPATGRGRCDEHRKAQEAQRSRARRADAQERNRMYARKRWAMTRKAKLFANPLCELEHPGCQGIANEVHHKTAMEDGGAEYDLDNLVSACKPCTAERQQARDARTRESRMTAFQRGSTGLASAGSPPQESNRRAAAAGARSRRTRRSLKLGVAVKPTRTGGRSLTQSDTPASSPGGFARKKLQNLGGNRGL